MRNQIRRTSLRKPSARGEPGVRHTGIDMWLVRGSHLAQFGLFLLTLWALFYTVIPLYRTAALEEQIARRETELTVLEKNLAETGAALKKANEEAYRRTRAEFLRGLTFRAGAECSGLLRPPELPSLLGEEPPTERPLLDINIVECVTAELLALKPTDTLRSEDWDSLQEAVGRTARSLEEQRTVATMTLRGMEMKTTEELRLFAQQGPLARQMDALIRQRYPGSLPPDSRLARASAVRDAQAKVARDFEERVRDEIGNLRRLKWPDPQAPAREPHKALIAKPPGPPQSAP
jgi:hypothetical protein